MAAEPFLAVNGYDLDASDEDLVELTPRRRARVRSRCPTCIARKECADSDQSSVTRAQESASVHDPSRPGCL